MAASGKAGGFLAASWGDGRVTERLHRTSFAMHEALAQTLDIKSYRKLRALRVDPDDKDSDPYLVPWLDGGGGTAKIMDEECAQVDPAELSAALLREARASGLCELRIAECVGISTEDSEEGSGRTCTGARLAGGEHLACDSLVVAMGPWSAKVEDWLGVPLPLEGVWSTSIVYEHAGDLEAAALFVDEDSRGCHLEVYPRPSGEVYVSGCGGSRLVSSEELRAGTVPPAAANAPDASRVRAAERSLSELSSIAQGGPSDRQQACLRPCAPDGLPILGRLPGVANTYVAAGHNTWGISWAPVTGLAMSQLVLEGESRVVNLRPFAPKRFDTMTYRTLLKSRGRQRDGVPVGEQW